MTNRMQIAVETFINYLRESQYGSRTHGIVELILATHAPHKYIRKLNCEDIDLEKGTLEVGIPKTSAVRKYDLRSTRTVELPTHTVKAIRTYWEYDRKDLTGRDRSPLFTTSAGQISTATLHRSIQKQSESALSPAKIPSSQKADSPESLSAKDIRQYSLTQIDP